MIIKVTAKVAEIRKVAIFDNYETNDRDSIKEHKRISYGYFNRRYKLARHKNIKILGILVFTCTDILLS